MLIGHRFERTAQDDLRIHSHNRVQSIAVGWPGSAVFIAHRSRAAADSGTWPDADGLHRYPRELGVVARGR